MKKSRAMSLVVLPVDVLLDDFVVFAVVELLHDLDELFVRKLADGGKTLGDNLVMAAVGTENEVVNTEGVRPDLQRWLPHR